MPNLVRINKNSCTYSDNLFPVFNGNITILAGGSDSTVIKDTNNKFFKESIKVENLTTGAQVDFKLDDGLEFTATQSGLHTFSMYIRKINDNADATVTIKFFKNGVNNADLTFIYNVYNSSGFDDDNWNCVSQSIPLNSSDTLSFTITSVCDEINTYVWYDAFKIEYSDRFVDNASFYTPPVDYFKNPTTGWAYYVDSLVTPTITIGTSYTQISIDALGATIDDHLPLEIRGTSQLWTGSKITPVAIGDDYDGRFDVTITAKTGAPTAIELIIDISGSTAGTNKAFTGWLQAIGTAPYDQSLPLDFFSLATFKANGGKIYARTDTGTVTIGRRNIKVSRKSKAF